METKKTHRLDDLGADEAAAVFAALGSASRLAILRQLVRAGVGGLPVGELQRLIGIPASTLSHHLRALVAAGVLEQAREGRTLICRAQYPRLEKLAAFLLSECCADAAPPIIVPATAGKERRA